MKYHATVHLCVNFPLIIDAEDPLDCAQRILIDIQPLVESIAANDVAEFCCMGLEVSPVGCCPEEPAMDNAIAMLEEGRRHQREHVTRFDQRTIAKLLDILVCRYGTDEDGAPFDPEDRS